jgi:hypothetical protein
MYSDFLILCTSGKKFPVRTKAYTPNVKITTLSTGGLVNQYTAMPPDISKQNIYTTKKNALCLRTSLGIVNLRRAIATRRKKFPVSRKAHAAYNTMNRTV